MQVIRSASAIAHDPRTVLTMGTFDGVHVGHARIIEEVVRDARARTLRSVLVTFDPHPREVLRHNGEQIHLLTTIEERITMLAAMGVDVCLVLPFTRDLSMLDADDFFHTVIVHGIGADRVVVGSDHAFGRGREGRPEALRRLGEAHGITVTIIPELTVGGEKVSSTAIRRALLSGDPVKARMLLGRVYTFSGVVQRGDGLGRTLGFPTANVRLSSERKLLPTPGVYAVTAAVNGRMHGGMMNIGTRPTVSDSAVLVTEVHLFDFDGDLYGTTVEIGILQRLRDERRFGSREELIAQLGRDTGAAAEILRQERNFKQHT